MTSRLERGLERWMLAKPFTARRAAIAIAIMTLVVTIVAGIVIRFLDPEDFANIWIGLWWAIQTVTTVGYGDVTPTSTWGRIVAGALMITGIGFLTVVTAAITAALVEGARRRRGAFGDEPLEAKLDEMNERLERLEALIRSGEGSRAPAAGPPPR